MDQGNADGALRPFAQNLVKAIKACRLYPAGNSTRVSHLEVAVRTVDDALAARGAIALGIREGAFWADGGVIYTDEDVRSGPTHLLATQAIFELTFQAGLERSELDRFVRVLAEDKSFARRRNEAMVTLLWRAHFTRVRYRHVDVLSLATSPTTMRSFALVEDDEVRKLRAELAELVRAMAVDEATGQDVIAITDRQLEAPEAAQLAVGESKRRIDWAVVAFDRRTGARDLESLRLELRMSSGREAMVVRLADAILARLAATADPCAAGGGVEVLAAVYGDLLRTESYVGAKHLVERARAMIDDPPRPVDRALGELLLGMFASDAVIGALFAAIDRIAEIRDAAKIIALIRACGDVAVTSVLSRLDAIERVETRELLCTLAIELTTGHREELVSQLQRARAEVATQLLHGAKALPPAELAALLAAAVGHAQPAVRSLAVRLIGEFSGPVSDQLVVRALDDSDAQVRTAGARAINLNPSEAGRRAVASKIGRTNVLDRDPGELRALFHAHATLGGEAAVEDLSRLLTSVSALTSGASGATIEAAANAIASIATDAARAILDKGAKSLNPLLRGPCKSALAAMEKAAGFDETLASFAQSPVFVSRPSWPASIGLDIVASRRASIQVPRTSLTPPPPKRPSALPVPERRPSMASSSYGSAIRTSEPPTRPSIDVLPPMRSKPPSDAPLRGAVPSSSPPPPLASDLLLDPPPPAESTPPVRPSMTRYTWGPQTPMPAPDVLPPARPSRAVDVLPAPRTSRAPEPPPPEPEPPRLSLEFLTPISEGEPDGE